MCPRHVGGRYPTPGFNGEGLSALSRLPFDTHDLTQRMHHVHQIALRFHHGVDGLVSHRRFVDNVRILTTLDTGGFFCLFIPPGGQPPFPHVPSRAPPTGTSPNTLPTSPPPPPLLSPLIPLPS